LSPAARLDYTEAVRLYGYWRSTSSWRVRIGLELKGVSYQVVPVHLLEDGGRQHAPEYLARNPMAQVPTLEWTELDGTPRRLTQSLAILAYLDDRHPEPRILPVQPFDRARVWELAEMVNAGIQPLQNLAVLQRIDEVAGDLGRKGWAAPHIVRGLTALETKTAEVAGTYAFGDTTTVADACLVPQLYAARRFGVDLDAFPTLTRVEEACAAHPAFQAAHPDRQPDAPKDPGGPGA
jgi:maleylpyruvate isomerase